MSRYRTRRGAPAWKVFEPATWDKFLAAIDAARQSLGFHPREECFFRGHADRHWQLLPTLLRYASENHLSGADTLDLEGSLFWEFQARAQALHHDHLSDWDYLFFMRHHGVYTRLLDWSEGLGVALYFALEHYRTGPPPGAAQPCVWLLNPYTLNQHADAYNVRDLVSPRYLGYIEKDDKTYDYGDVIDIDLIHWTMPVAIYPIQRSNRVRAQRGWFTIQGKSSMPLEAQAPANVAQVVLPAKAIGDALRFLDHAGLNEYTMYADLDSLARELHRKNGVT